MTHKHTPGPWAANETFVTHGDKEIVCAANYGEDTVSRANARLIAAAPELLELLSDIVQAFDQHDDCSNIDVTAALRNKARAVIARLQEAV